MIQDYYEHTPRAPLDTCCARMAHAHFLQPVTSERLAPDSYVKLSFILEGHPYYRDGAGNDLPWLNGFAGHMSAGFGALTFSLRPVRVAWLNFTPSGFYRLFKRPVHELSDLMEPPERMLGERAAELHARLRNTAPPPALFAVLEEFIAALAGDDDLGTFRPMQLVEQLIRETNGTAPVTELAAIAGMSVRQLERRSLIELGASPKAFSSIVRFNHAYRLMRNSSTLDVDTALACGYYDESHMLRDLTLHLGETPKQFVHLVRPVVDRNLGH